MNEIVPESPEKSSDLDDQSSYIQETPEKIESLEATQKIPIPSLTRIRKFLGILDNNVDISPTKRRVKDNQDLAYFIKKQKKHKEKLKKVKITLFHDKPKEPSFSLNPKSFYGISNKPVENLYILPPEPVKPLKQKNFTKRQNCSTMHKRTAKKHKLGEINRGVSHGIKKPKQPRSSSRNNSKENVKKTETTQPVKQITTCNDDTKIHDSTKKFFKYVKPKNNTKMTSRKHGINACDEKAINLPNSISTINDSIKDQEVHECLIDVININNLKDPIEKCKIIDYVPIVNAINVKETQENQKIEQLQSQEDLVKQKNINELLKILEADWENMDTLENIIICDENMTPLINSEKNSEDSQMDSIAENICEQTIDKNSENICDKVTQIDEIIKEKQYYPLFDKGYTSNCALNKANLMNIKINSNGKFVFNRDENEYQINVEQKLLGAIQCKECKFVYHCGEKDDENAHIEYHDDLKILKFSGWKNERIVYHKPLTTTRIIVIEPTDACIYHDKIEQVLNIVNRELNLHFDSLLKYKDNKVYLYIKEKKILGILVTEHIKTAFRMIPEYINLNCCTSESTPVKCGVSILWTAKGHRREGIATKLLDVLRTNYCYGYIMSTDDIAFSAPTLSGKLFAEKYTKSSNFKVY